MTTKLDADAARARLLAILSAGKQVRDTAPPAPAHPAPNADELPIVKRQAKDTAALSPAQESLWFLEELNGSSALYNVVRATRLEGRLEPKALEHALQRVVLRHDSLRSRIRQGTDGAEVEVLTNIEVNLPVCEIGPLEGHALRQAISAEAVKPLDLTRGAPWRFVLFRRTASSHVLLTVVHHLFADGWSMGILAKEVSAFYETSLSGGAMPEGGLRPLHLQFTDCAAWLRQAQEQGRQSQALNYWSKQLAGISALELPTDRPRPARLTHRGGWSTFRLPTQTRERVHALAARKGMTPFLVLLTAFKVLLKRLANQDDVAVGTPVAGRSRPEFEDQIGYFVNAVVLRSDLGGNPSFGDALNRIQQTTLDAFDHQDLSFDRLVAHISPQRDPSRNPLFQVSFALQSYPTDTVRLPGLDCQRLSVPVDSAKFDLSLEFVDDRQQLFGSVEYNSDLFDAATIERWQGHFQTLLDAVLSDPSLPIDAAPLLTDVEHHQILREWNATQQPYSLAGSVQALVEAQAQRTPHAMAVSLDAQVLDYATLNAKANAVARQLRARGVGRDVIVGVCMERSFELLIGLLGVLKAGGAFLPMDPELPPERLAFMLEDAETPVVLTQPHLCARLAEVPAAQNLEVIPVDERELSPAGEAGDNLNDLNRSEDLSYAIFTSGSTGRPKGALNTHRGLVNHVLWLKDALRLQPSDRVAHKTTISFDAAIWEIFTPLVCGAGIVLARPGIHRDTQALTEFVIDQSVSVLQMVPSALRVLLSEPRIRECTSLRYVVSGGEALEATLAQQFQDTLGHAVLGNFYGPSEASDDATWFELGTDIPARQIVPIGRPIGNVRCHILDSLRQLVPIGVVGELHVGGDSVGRGYLKRPDLTAEKFVDDPFHPGQKLYRSGDLARHLPDGTIEYVGRIDHQVKIRGQRVELGEIEAQLKTCPGVSQSAVLLREDRAGHPRLVAYVVADAPAVAGLKAHLGKQLPAHMVPSSYIRLDVLPTLPNGKLDRKSLPAPQDVELRTSPSGARSPMEEVLIAIWSEMLGSELVGIHDNFFDLGGHSLVATRIAARVRAQLNQHMPLSWLFESPTVAELATRLAAAAIEPGEPALTLPVASATDPSVRREAPVSFTQRQMWLLQQSSPASGAYNMSSALVLRGALDLDRLATAMQDVTASHAAFRTRFVMQGSEPIQVIEPSGAVMVERLDARSLPPEARQAHVTAWFAERVRRPFQLDQAPLCRMTLVSLDTQETALLVVLHHVIADAWSLGIVMQEISERYQRSAAGTATATEPTRLSYADYAVWLRQRLNTAALDRLWSYWGPRLSGLQPMRLPYDRTPPLQRLGDGGRVFRAIPHATLQRLREFSLTRGLTPTMTLMSALGIQLRALSGDNDIIIGTPVANRSAVELERLVGVMINPVLLRLALGDKPTFDAAVQHVREVALGAYAHQDMPMDELEMRLRRTGQSVGQALQVLFTVLTAPVQPFELPDVACQALSSSSCAAQVDLAFQISLDESRSVSVTYAKDILDEQTATRWLDDYLALLDDLVASPTRDLNHVLVGARSLEREVGRWNDTHAPFDGSIPVSELLVRQAQKTPESVAIVDGDLQLSYAELDARSNQIARALRAHGVGRGSLVGLCLQRSADLLVAQWGILKSGAAYVPLDPAYPQERLAHMAEDASLALLVTQADLASMMNWPRESSLWIDQDAPLINQQPRTSLSPDDLSDARPGDPAYVIYTSGSTGKPKGVLVQHSAVINFLESMRREPGLQASDRLLAVTTLSFDIHVLELLLPIAVGAQVILASRETAMDSRALAALLSTHQATVMQATPSTWRLLIDAGWQGHTQFKALIGGEPLPADLAESLLERTGSLWNMYGPTETTVWSTCGQVQFIERGITVGRPIANTQIHILDEHLRPRPVGAVGEICIGGAGVSLGYLNRPELTAERFVPLAGLTPPGGQVYRTGDLGRWRNDGTLEHLGRMDSQVKVRGHRIELGEIETALARHPQVSQAVVTVHEPQPGDVRLVAYVVGQQPLPSLAEVRSHLSQTLPAYMLPHQLMELAAVPLLPNGKVDRKALPQPQVQADTAGGQQGTEALSEQEESMALIWQQVLGLPTVPSVESTFHDLGGHSLLAAKLVSTIEQALGRPCSMQQLFRAPSIRLLCAELAQSSTGSTTAVTAEVIPLTMDISKPKLFCICGVYLYKPLADQLAAEFSVLGIFLPYEKRLISDHPSAASAWPSVEEMAADYVAAITARQPQGPYRLMGVSFGGVVAYEIAQQLRRAGHAVELVGLLDAMLSHAIRIKPLRSLLRKTALSASRAFSRLVGRPSADGLKTLSAYEKIVVQRETIYLRAIAAYQPETYPDRVVLVRAREQHLRFDQQLDALYGWGGFAKKLSVIDADGDHIGHLKSPHVDALGPKLLQLLRARDTA